MGKTLNPGNLYLENTVHVYTTLGKVIFREEHKLLVCEHKIPTKISRHTWITASGEFRKLNN
jgi:hypothetical protein